VGCFWTDPQTKLDPHSIEAPPWNVPACDPTAGNSAEYGTVGDGGGNSCRLAFGSAAGNSGTKCGSTGQNTPADCHLLATLTFAEAAVDMNFFGIGGTCFSTMIFTSRSSQTLGDVGSDLKDIGGGEVDICGSKSGRKFEDLNGDGDDEGGEDPSLSGWTINLYEDDGDGVLEAGESTPLDTFVTDSNGEYEFTGLEPGDYIVCEVISDQAGWLQTFPTSSDSDAADCSIDSDLAPVGHAFEIEVLEDEAGNDFGNFERFDKSGTKFEDLDGDGDITEDSANTLSGWDIKIYDDVNGDGDLDSGDTLITTDATDANGDYEFPDLGPGDYIVCEVLQNGWVQTAPASGADCSFDSSLGPVGYAFSGASGTDHENNDFGNFELVEKRGTKFEDSDGDGNIAEDSANVLSGWEIRIYEDDGDGVLESGELASAVSDTTDGNGDYEFANLGPGSYIVCEVLQSGWVQTHPVSGTADCSVDSALGAEGHAFTTSSGTDHENNDFGNFELVEKRGTKFEDNDGDGDITESPDVTDVLSEWTIKIYKDVGSDPGDLDATDEFLASDTTDANGNYEFANLGPGSYVVCEVLLEGWIQTFPTSGADCTADASFGPFGYAFTTASGVDHEDNDFGNFELITKSGTKFKDTNGDGDVTGDSGLGGWTINIYEDAGTVGTLDAADTLIGTDVTDANGEYAFPSLGPGSYIVCEVAQDGWEQTLPTSGADCTFDPLNSPIGYAFTASSGVDHLDNDFANTELFRMIVITCGEATETLVVSEVDPDFTPPAAGDTDPELTIGTPPPLSGKTTAELQAYLCNLGGAQFNELPRGDYGTDTEIPDVP
jgi:hypothetical protein